MRSFALASLPERRWGGARDDPAGRGVRLARLRSRPCGLPACRSYRGQVPDSLRVVVLGRAARHAVPALTRYLGEVRPAALLSALENTNIAAAIVRSLPGKRVRTVLGIHNQMSVAAERAEGAEGDWCRDSHGCSIRGSTPWSRSRRAWLRISRAFSEFRASASTRSTTLRSSWREYDAASERAREMRAPRYRIMGQIRDAIEKRMEQEAFEKWMEEHGDEGLWPAYRRTLRFKAPRIYWLESVLDGLIEAGVDLNGMTVGAMLEEARRRGFALKASDEAIAQLPLDLVLKLRPEEALPARLPQEALESPVRNVRRLS